jgi:putative ABC transport system permease protein
MIFTGWVFCLFLSFVKSINRSANRFLALALLVMTLWMLRILDINLPAQMLLSVGPLLYFYVLKITHREHKFNRKDLLHLSPLVFAIVPAPILQILVFISVIVYLYLANRLIQKFYKSLQPVLMDRSLLEFRWLRRLLAATALLWVLWIVSELGLPVYGSVYIFFAVMIIWTAAAAFLRPQTGIAKAIQVIQRTAPSELKQKSVWLKKMMESHHYYLDSELSLSSLAGKLSLTTHELSRILNTALKKSFYDFINEYRVREVIRKMQDPAYDRITLLGMAYDAGFNSKATFMRAFKQLTGESPAAYKRELEKKVSSYRVQPHHRPGQLILVPEVPVWSPGQLNYHYMFRNYLKIAWRNILRNKIYALINITGLCVGLACCLLILMYVLSERSYDRFNTNADNIYRVTRTFYSDDGAATLHTGSVAPPFGPLLKNAFPDIKEVTRLFPPGNISVKYSDKLLNEKNAFYAEANLFDFFNVPVLMGDKRSALREPYSVMLSEDAARKYFGNADPMEKMIKLGGNKHEFKVTGIFQPFPVNSHLHPELLLSFNTLRDTAVYGDKLLQTMFNHNAFYTYLLFPENYNVAAVEKHLPAFLDEYVHLAHTPSNKKTHQATSLGFQKLTDIHLHSHLDTEIEENGDVKRVNIFSAIALFILLIACINYMNLSTARSVLRAREIGVRKVIGARRIEIIIQFLGESVLITLIALGLALAVTVFLVPVVNKLSGQSLSVHALLTAPILLAVLALPFVIGFISGIYPALFLSSFLPVKILKGVLNVGKGNISFRKVLVVVQFSVSIILIVATIVVYRQLQYIQNKELGFNKDHILTGNMAFGLNSKFEAFRTDLLKNPAIIDASRSSDVPSDRLLRASDAAVLQDGAMRPLKVDLKFINTDYNFLETYGVQLIAGRGFSRDYQGDVKNYLINEAGVKALGWKNAQEAIGKDLTYGGIQGKIIGVVKDFHFESLHQKIIPLLFFPSPFNFYFRLSVKVDGHHTASAVAALMNTWHKYEPEAPFEYTFLDDKFSRLYQSEGRQESLFTVFSGIAIFIACLGLLGLSSFTITQRMKEIGIRKVLGATVPQIVGELSKDFIRLVLIASVIAFPVAWYAMNQWLGDFAFHVTISWWVFVIAGAAALLIAFITISYESLKAALMNPVKSLRSE